MQTPRSKECACFKQNNFGIYSVCRVGRRHFALILLPQLAQQLTQHELHGLPISHPVQ